MSTETKAEIGSKKEVALKDIYKLAKVTQEKAFKERYADDYGKFYKAQYDKKHPKK